MARQSSSTQTVRKLAPRPRPPGRLTRRAKPRRISARIKGPGEFFKGGIDDVRLYNRALSTGEIKTMALADGKAAVDGIVGWWKLDGDLKNSAAKTATGSVAQFRGIDRKWKATPFSLAGARLDIRAAGEVGGSRHDPAARLLKRTFPYTPALIRAGTIRSRSSVCVNSIQTSSQSTLKGKMSEWAI